MSNIFRPGEHAMARHPHDGSWYKVVVERLDKTTGLLIVSVPCRPDAKLRKFDDPPRRRWLVDPSDVRRL